MLAGALVLVACGGDDGAAVDAGGAGDDELAPWCGDLEPLGPIAEGNLAGPENADDVVLGVIATYLDEHAETFAGDWIDREHSGTYVMAFTPDPEAHLRAILELPLDAATSGPATTDAPAGRVDLSGATTTAGEPLPPPEPPMTDAPPDTEGLDLTGTVGDSDTAVDTVLATYTVRELEALQDEALDRLADTELDVFGVGRDTKHNRVHLDIEDPDDEARRLVGERLEADAVCVSGSATDVAPPTSRRSTSTRRPTKRSGAMPASTAT